MGAVSSAVLPSVRESESTPEVCLVKTRLSKDLSAVGEAILSLQEHLDKPQTVMALVHPECLRFELQTALERKKGLLEAYEQHRTSHGC